MKQKYEISNSDILLRLIKQDDIELLRNWRNQDSVRSSFVCSGLISKEEQEQWFERYSKDEKDYMFISLYKGEPVGAVALYSVDKDKKTAEFGRLMLGNTNLRGIGLGKKLTRLAIRLGFEQMGLEQIYLEVFQDNIYAFNTYEALGFHIIGYDHKMNRDVYVMGTTKEDWSP